MRDKKWLKQQKREAERLRQLNALETDSGAEESSTMPADPEVFVASLETAMNLATVHSFLPAAGEMDVAAQLQVIRAALKYIYPFEPRPKQVEAIHFLKFHRVDLILIAKKSISARS